MMSTLQQPTRTATIDSIKPNNSVLLSSPTKPLRLDDLPCQCGVHLAPVAWLKAHEEFIPARFEEVLSETVSAGGYHWPIIVDSKSGVILDGHHRHQVSLRLGLQHVPAVLVDYLADGRISVRQWTPESEQWAGQKAEAQAKPSYLVWDSTAQSKKVANKKDSDNVSESSLTTEAGSGHDSQASFVSSPSPRRSDFEKTVEARDDDVFIIAAQSGKEGQQDAEFAMVENTPPASGSIENGCRLALTPSKSATDGISKEHVVQMGMSPSLYPPKTTRHFIPAELYCRPIFVPLEILKEL